MVSLKARDSKLLPLALVFAALGGILVGVETAKADSRTNTGPLTAVRTDYGTTLLPKGEVLVGGGENGSPPRYTYLSGAAGAAPTLLLLAKSGEETLRKEEFCRVGTLLHQKGWNVVSLDLPCHGAESLPGEPPELAGWAARTAAGNDIVLPFCERVDAVLRHLVKIGFADPEHMAVGGISRGGFMAFQAAAGNPLLRAVVAFAPVTDLAALNEFAGQQTNQTVERLALMHYADALAGRASWTVIGNSDERVGTDQAVGFIRAIARAAQNHHLPPRVTLQVVPTPGHSSQPEWHDQAAVWLDEWARGPRQRHNDFVIPSTGLRVSEQVALLAVDDAAVPLKKNLCFYLNKPTVRAEPVLGPSRDNPAAPDRLAAMFFGSVLFDQGKFRMWYSGYHTGRNPDWPGELLEQFPEAPRNAWQGPICYAESQDGIHWTKPALNQVMFKGSKANNALSLPNIFVCAPHVLKEDNEPDSNRRYKMTYWFQDKKHYPAYPSFRTAVSPDGLHWSVENARPTDLFVEGGGLYKFNGLYILNAHSFCGFIKSEGGHETGRWGIAMVSPDFRDWLPEWAESFVLPEPADPKERGAGEYTQVHQGTAAMSYGNVMVGVATLWHNRKKYTDIGGDLNLVVSNDGLAFREPVKGHVYLSRSDSAATAIPGRKIETVLLQGNGIFNHGDNTYIYHGRWRNAWTGGASTNDLSDDYCGEVALATLPRDRWGALGLYPRGALAKSAQGSAWSYPVRVPEGGWRMRLNADGVPGIRIEIGDERFNSIRAFSGVGAATAKGGDGLDVPFEWPRTDIGELAGQTVRFRFIFKRGEGIEPRLFAAYLSAEHKER